MTGKVAIIGTGPSGCYLAQALAKSRPDAEITLIDRLPVPYGLVRYGVAPDHQGTKAVTRQFARLFERQGVGFIGNLTIGDGPGELPLDDLRSTMDAVVLAPGLHVDRGLDVPGADLPGIHGAGAITRHWNGHPDTPAPTPALGRSVAIIGNGNVAVDLLRVLAKGADDFDGSDFDPAHVADSVQTIHVVGRARLDAAKFDTVMIKELAALTRVSFELAEGDNPGDPQAPTAAAVLALCARTVAAPVKRVVFHSGWHPATFAGTDRVAAAVLHSTTTDATRDIACDSVITAIGFREEGAGLDRNALIGAAQDAESGVIAPGLFATGWFRRGPRGTIPDNRSDAQGVAVKVAEHLNACDPATPGRAALLDRFGSTLTDYADWAAIDATERAAASPGRCRAKLTTRAAMQAVIDARRHSA